MSIGQGWVSAVYVKFSSCINNGVSMTNKQKIGWCLIATFVAILTSLIVVTYGWVVVFSIVISFVLLSMLIYGLFLALGDPKWK
jgi:fluoride ion exporter CrcB/FEX